jgi:hypothetical protein
MKRILIISCFGLLLQISIFGQIDSSVYTIRNETINKSDYVFEGVIIKQTIYLRKNHMACSNIVKITKVFRGNLKPGTVEIVSYTNMFIANNTDRDVCDAACLKKYNRDTLGIFFCRVAKEFPYSSKYNVDALDNKTILTDYHNNEEPYGDGDRILSPHYGYKGMPGLNENGRIRTKAQVYQMLRKYPNLKIPDYAEPEPWDTIHDSRFGPDATFKNMEQLKAHRDSVVRAHALKKQQHEGADKDSLKIGVRP